MWSNRLFPKYYPGRKALGGGFWSPGWFGSANFGRGCGILFALGLIDPSAASAQEALRNSLAGDAAAEANLVHAENLPYTIKSGDFRLLLVPSLGMNWNDNINITKTNAMQDYIVQPQMQLNASYPLTENNLLSLNVGGGYSRYMEHPDASSWFLSSGTGLGFDIYVKDFWFNLHDFVSYSLTPSQQPLLSGTATYPVIHNTAGLSVTWDLNKFTLTSGFDHQNTFSTSAQFADQASTTESALVRGGFLFRPDLTAGVEGTAAFTTYEQNVLNNYNAYSAGVYANFQPGKFFSVQPRFGYTISQPQHTSQSIQSSDVTSWYADLRITHQVNDLVSYTLDAGHELIPGIQSDFVEDYYLRSSVNWYVIHNVTLTTTLTYQYGQQGVGNVTGNLSEYYNYVGTGVSISYAIFKKCSLSLNYNYTLRSSTLETDAYTQNVVGILLTYRP